MRTRTANLAKTAHNDWRDVGRPQVAMRRIATFYSY